MGRSTRREFMTHATALAAAGAFPLPASASAQDASSSLITRPIPRTGERLPAIGLGTAQVFDVGDDSERRAALAQVLRTLVDGGGSVIDTASSYGSAEQVVGALVAQADLRRSVFIATKTEAPDDAELRESLRRLRTARADLVQLHNVSDPRQSLAQFREWKARGLCRYVGITSTFHRDFPALASVLEHERPDFVEVDYSIDNREAERRILPLAGEVRAAVLVALPFGRGRLFRAVHGKPLPGWAREFDARSWAQFFLKFLLGHPAVTVAIPGTADPAHMLDNLGAMRGRLPDAEQRRRMVELVQSL
jgi:aryl-alcohol dehydrogenase-like predicted oxidoreductase